VHYEDLAPCTYFGERPGLIAVGWLEDGHPYTRGKVEREEIDLLAMLLADAPAFQPLLFMGYHLCSLCMFPRRRRKTRWRMRATGQRLAFDVGVFNLLVPAEGVVYATPSLVFHYVLSHHYRPPDAFWAAAWACRSIGSAEYKATVRRLVPGL